MDILAWNSLAASLITDFAKIPDTQGAAKYPDDPQLVTLVGELSVQDPDFRQWWAAHHVAGQRIGTKTLHHPVVGDLSLDWDTLTCATDHDQQLITWTAEPGTPTHDRLRILASWTAEHHQSATT